MSLYLYHWKNHCE